MALGRCQQQSDYFASDKGTLHQQSKLNQSHSVCVSSLLKSTLLFVALSLLQEIQSPFWGNNLRKP